MYPDPPNQVAANHIFVQGPGTVLLQSYVGPRDSNFGSRSLGAFRGLMMLKAQRPHFKGNPAHLFTLSPVGAPGRKREPVPYKRAPVH